MDRLFVYGSLKANGSAHHLLRGSVREADGVLEQAELTQVAGYPRLKPGTGEVSGEVYRIPADRWVALDAWEEVPEQYQRCQQRLQDGRIVWVYASP